MGILKLWTKLFTRNDEGGEIALHVSGATIRHRNPFETLDVLRNDDELSKEFIDKWVVPFYMNSLSNLGAEMIKLFSDTAKEIDINIVRRLLGDFDWRPRITGAFFAAIKGYIELEEIIGTHLLKSEVCYAGQGYCLALAAFNNDKAKEYLTKYLDYYLDRKDLWFEQADAYCALEYIDKAAADKMQPKWTSFILGKEHWSLEATRQHFSKGMVAIGKIKQLS